jgi:hypothetical protein
VVGVAGQDGVPSTTTVYTEVVMVECDLEPHVTRGSHIERIDHHRAGDRGYGRPPAEFASASSIGQVAAALGLEMTPGLLLVAAADHCLAAAYRGECPGVDPDELMRWRVVSRATFQGRDPSTLLVDIEATRRALRVASRVTLGSSIDAADMRREPPWPELPEAAARENAGYISGPLTSPDGRRKITCVGTPDVVAAFLECWAPAHGVIDCYGDPARGFAGGYIA